MCCYHLLAERVEEKACECDDEDPSLLGILTNYLHL